MVELFIKLGLPAAQAEIFAEHFIVTEKLSPGKFFLKEGAICQKIGISNAPFFVNILATDQR